MVEKEDPLTNPILRLQEKIRDGEWIEKNLSRFWPIASAGHERFGRGAITVQPHTWEESDDYSTFDFAYTTEEIIQGDEEVEKFVREYNPDNQFVIIIEKQGHLTVTGSPITSIYKPTLSPDFLDELS